MGSPARTYMYASITRTLKQHQFLMLDGRLFTHAISTGPRKTLQYSINIKFEEKCKKRKTTILIQYWWKFKLVKESRA